MSHPFPSMSLTLFASSKVAAEADRHFSERFIPVMVEKRGKIDATFESFTTRGGACPQAHVIFAALDSVVYGSLSGLGC